MDKYYRRGAPRFLLSSNEAARPGAAFIVFTGKPGLVASLQLYTSRSEARDYVDALPSDSIHVLSYIRDELGYGHHLSSTGTSPALSPSAYVLQLVHVINPSQDLHRDKLIRIIDKMSNWYYRTQVEGLRSNDEED
ncbi:hypothetical protein QE357_002673 [Siphonobacter sp. BAB-5404]|nr:hypothetical protein [Siphonobacter sp. SORGH_AS_0500]